MGVRWIEGERKRRREWQASELNKPCTAPTDLCNRHNFDNRRLQGMKYYFTEGKFDYYVLYSCTWPIKDSRASQRLEAPADVASRCLVDSIDSYIDSFLFTLRLLSID